MYRLLRLLAFALMFVFAVQANANDVISTKRPYDYCTPKGTVSSKGVIVRFGSRYIHMCEEPLNVETGRMLLLQLSPRVMTDEVGIAQFKSVRLDECFPYETKFERSKSSKLKSEQVRFGTFIYDRYDTDVRTHDGVPSASIFDFVHNRDGPKVKVPPHFFNCNFPDTADRPTTMCRIFVRYYDLKVSLPIFQGGDLFVQTPLEQVPNTVERMMKLVEFADVTDHVDALRTQIPVYD